MGNQRSPIEYSSNSMNGNFNKTVISQFFTAQSGLVFAQVIVERQEKCCRTLPMIKQTSDSRANIGKIE